MHSLPLFMRVKGQAVMLLGKGEAANAKRRLLERAGALIVGEETDACLAIVALEGEEADAAVARLRARGMLVNAVDHPDLCDFTLPAIVDRDPVLVAIGTGGASAGLAAALRQRLEALLPASLGMLARQLHGARAALRARFPDGGDRRRAIGAALAPGGPLDPLRDDANVETWLSADQAAAPVASPAIETITLTSADPDVMTVRAARLLGQADRVHVIGKVPPAILARIRADADRLPEPPSVTAPGLTVILRLEVQ